MDEQSLFAELLELTDPAEREVRLDQATRNDRALRDRMERLLAKHAAAGSFLERPPPGTEEFAAAAMEEPEAVIGAYRLLERIGEGGMGVVYLAEQSKPVHRRVALKIIKPGMDTREVVARFNAERQALAIMDHPNIAKVFDGGSTSTGRPYFVMELVRGLPITEYCDQARLTPQTRLKLFVQVCRAVQHAHQKAIIHRDLKPSNILITLHDGEPVPKVIDFGVAKAVGQRSTEQSAYTRFTQMIGTPLYMSPEQAELSALDIDTRSDVYSLGVLLYELLTGTTPFESDVMRKASFDELRRIIREDEPPRPSARISTLDAATRSTTSSQRGLDERQLSRLLSGDLDWIVMKSLEKDRNRRYESAGAFAADVERYLANEPVEARPPSKAYRVRKFVRRNRAFVATAISIVVLLIAGIWAEARQRQRAEEHERQAIIEAATASAVKEFLKSDLLELATATNQYREEQEGLLKVDPDLKVRDLVLRAAKRIEGRFQDQPLVEAELRTTLSQTLMDFGEYELAIRQSTRAREIYTANLSPTHSDTLVSMHDLATALGKIGRHTEALELCEETNRLHQANLGPDDPMTLMGMINLGVCYQNTGRNAEAIQVHEATHSRLSVLRGPDNHGALICLHNLAQAYETAKRHEDALRSCEELLRRRKTHFGPDHPRTLSAMNLLASISLSLGRKPEAVKLFEETLKLQKAKLGDHHPDTVETMGKLAGYYHETGRTAEALQLRESTLRAREHMLGADHPLTLRDMKILALEYSGAGRDREALRLFEKVLERHQAKHGAEHPETLKSMANVAIENAKAGRLTEAVPIAERVLRLMKETMGADHPDTLESMDVLASVYKNAGRQADGIQMREESLALHKKRDGPDHRLTLRVMSDLATDYLDAGRSREALQLQEENYRLMQSKHGPDHGDTIHSMYNLAGSYVNAGRNRDAVPLLERALQWLSDKLGPDHPFRLDCMTRLAGAYSNVSRHEEASKAMEEVIKRQTVKLGADDQKTLNSTILLAHTYLFAARDRDALRLYEEVLKLRQAKLGRDHPDTASTMRFVARILATASDPELRDPQRAIELALPATLIWPKHASIRDCLGTARLSAGDWKGAITEFEMAISLREPDDWANATSALPLAQAYWQSGEKDKAHEWFDKGVQWMKKGQKDRPDVKRLHAETSRLLELSPGP